MKFLIFFLSFLFFLSVQMKKSESNLFYFYACKNTFIENLNNNCDLLKINSGKTNADLEEYFSIVLEIKKELTESFICEATIENNPQCENELKICSNKKNVKKKLKMFMRLIKEQIHNNKKHPHHRVLILNISEEYLTLAYYYFDLAINKKNLFNFFIFDLIIFQTEKANYLYRVYSRNKPILYLKKRNLKLIRNKNYVHHYLQNSIKRNFRELENKTKQCLLFNKILKFYLQNKKCKQVEYYYHPIINAIVNKQQSKTEIKLILKDLDLTYQPKCKNNSKNFLQVSSESRIPEDEMYFNNKYKSRGEFLDKSLNERARGRQKGMKKSLFNNTLINLYIKMDGELREKPDIDFINLKQ